MSVNSSQRPVLQHRTLHHTANNYWSVLWFLEINLSVPTDRKLLLFSTQAVDFNIFEGMECHGVAVTTISQGRVVYDNKEVGENLILSM